MNWKLLLLFGILLISFVSATYYPSGLGALESFPANINLVSPYNLTANWVFANRFDGTFIGSFLGDINSSSVKYPPAACPGSSAITSFNDNFSSATCSDLWVDVAGDNMTGTLFANNITPTINDTYSLGTPDLKWKDLYVGPGSIYLGDYILNEDTGSLIISKNVTDLLTINGTTGFITYANEENKNNPTGIIMIKGDIDNPVKGDIKIEGTIVYKYQKGEWKKKVDLGASVETDNFFLDSLSGHFGFEDVSGDYYNLIKPSTTKGAVVGNGFGRVGFVTDGRLDTAIVNTTSETYAIMQPISSSNKSFSEEKIFTTPNLTIDLMAKGITFYLHEPATNVRLEMKDHENNTLSETCLENKYLDENCSDYSAGLQNISITFPIPLQHGEGFDIYIKGDINLKGYLNGSEFTPYWAFTYHPMIIMEVPHINSFCEDHIHNFTKGDLVWGRGTPYEDHNIYVATENISGIGWNDSQWKRLGSEEEIQEYYKNSLGTGLISGGIASKGTYNISWTAGTALIVNVSDASNIQVDLVSFPATTVDPSMSGKRSMWAYVIKNSTGGGEIVITDDEPTPLDSHWETSARLSKWWTNGTGEVIRGHYNYGAPAYNLQKRFEAFLWIFGTIKKSGNSYTFQGANRLLTKSAGVAWRAGAGYSSDPTEPDIFSSTEANISTYGYYDQNDLTVTEKTEIDNLYWDNAGTLVELNNNYWKCDRVWGFPGSGYTHVSYGQAQYASASEALSGYQVEGHAYNKLSDGAYLGAWVCIKKGMTDCSNDNNCVIRNAGTSAGGGGGGVGVTYSAGEGLILNDVTDTEFRLNTTYTDNRYLNSNNDTGNFTLFGNLTVNESLFTNRIEADFNTEFELKASSLNIIRDWPNHPYLNFFQDDTQVAAITTYIDKTDGAYLGFYTKENGSSTVSEKMRISEDGKVGIGTTTPQNELNVVGQINATTSITSPSIRIDPTGYFQLQSGNPIMAFDGNDYLSYDRSANNYDFRIEGSTKMFIESDGFGVGTSSPRAGFDAFNLSKGTGNLSEVVGIFSGDNTAGSQSGFMFTGDASNSDIWIQLRPEVNSNGWIIGSRFFQDDYLAFNYVAPTDLQWPGEGTIEFRVNTNGDVSGTHGTYHTSSDESLKYNITNITNALDKITSMRGVTFNWNESLVGNNTYEDKKYSGLIAQEVESVYPELIHTDNSSMKSIEWWQMNGLYVEAIKELKEENDAMKVELCNVNSSYSWC